MSDLTREQHLKLAAGVLKILADHGADITAIAGDVPKAIGIGHDMKVLVEEVKGTPTYAPMPSSNPMPTVAPAPTLDAALKSIPQSTHSISKPPQRAAKPVTAHEVAHAVAQDGLTPQEKAIFARDQWASGL